MRQPQAGGRRKKPVLEEFEALGVDLRFLEHLQKHPALDVIARLHQDELDKAQAAAGITELNDKLAQCRKLALSIRKLATLATRANRWVNLLGKVQLDALLADSEQAALKRKGAFIDFPANYFYAACLAPYTACLAAKAGRPPAPLWTLIERWIVEYVGLNAHNLRQLWDKEILGRKKWPSRTLLYALSSGVAVPLEQHRGGRRASWTLEWTTRPGRIPARIEQHPLKLKRSLAQNDRAYLEFALKYVPLARWDIVQAYPEAADWKISGHDVLGDILADERSRRMEALPARFRSLVMKFSGEHFVKKAEFAKELDKLIKAIPPEERTRLKKLTKKHRR